MKQEIFSKMECNSLIYVHIVYQIYKIVEFYSTFLGADTHGDIFRGIKSCHDFEDCKKNITVFEIEFANISENSNRYHKIPEGELIKEKNIINEHLAKIVSNNQLIPPYRYGEKSTDIVYPLYIDKIYRDKDSTYVCVIYVDNPVAYNAVKKEKELAQIEKKEMLKS